jgi:hypothetical protein
MTTNQTTTANPPFAESAGSAFVYRLRDGAIVHPICREAYQRKHASSHNYPGIEAALYPGYQPMSRFQLCKHCEAPIWDAPNDGTERRRELEKGNS